MKIGKIIEFDPKYDRKRGREELKVILQVILGLAVFAFLVYFFNINYENLVIPLAIYFLLIYKWHRARLKK